MVWVMVDSARTWWSMKTLILSMKSLLISSKIIQLVWDSFVPEMSSLLDYKQNVHKVNVLSFLYLENSISLFFVILP